MEQKRTVGLMICKLYTTVRAHWHMTAALAYLEIRIAPPVQKKDRLLAFFNPVLYRVMEMCGYYRSVSRTVLFRHVDDLDFGQHLRTRPFGQLKSSVDPFFASCICFQTRCRRAEDKRTPVAPASELCNFRRVIHRPVTLFVSRFVLFIDDDGADILKRSEDTAPCADGYSRPAFFDLAPFIIFLTGGKTGVEHRHIIAETHLETVHHLRCQCDFRNEHDCRLSLFQYFLDDLQVDFRLASSCRSVVREW